MKLSSILTGLLLTSLFFSLSSKGQVPTISSVSPDSGHVGSTVTITGTNFASSYNDNIVYFGATRAKVSPTSTTTSLIVQPDSSATYAPIFVLDSVTGLSCYQQSAFFNPNYTNYYFIHGLINYKSFQNFGTGSTENLPITAAIGDLNGDGKPDLAVNCRGAGAPGSVKIFQNTSTRGVINSSSFSSPTTPIVAASVGVGLTSINTAENIKIADIDGDGKPDLVVTSEGTGRIYVFRNSSSFSSITFDTGQFYSSRLMVGGCVIAIADYDGDGKPDIAVSSVSTNNFVVFRNTATPGAINASSFDTAIAFTAGADNLGICTADFNGDQKPDIAIVDTVNNVVSILRNISTSGHINFASRSTYPTGTTPTDVQTADLNGDGKMDLIISNELSNTMTVLENTSSATDTITFGSSISIATGNGPVGVAAADLDGDGKLDVVVNDAADNAVSIFRNIGSPGSALSTSTFAAASRVSNGLAPLGITVGDLDGDGYPDIVSGNYLGGNISILQNYPLPYVPAISGDTSICITSDTTSFTDSISGGRWSLSNTTIATINSTGLVTFLHGGRDTIYYTITAGGDTNRVMKTLRIDSYPIHLSGISGSSSTCPGGTTTLSDSVTGGTWATSAGSSGVATISPTTGVVHGVGVGTTIITYTYTNLCTSVDTTLSFTVNASSSVSAITGPSASICPGSSITLSDSTSGGVWSSSDTTIATVNSSGVVHGVATGHTTIIYTYTNSCGSSSASRSVTVSGTASAGVITGSTAPVCTGSTVTLSDTASGGTWRSSNTSVATVTATGIVTGVSSGTVTISYTDSTSCGTSATTTRSVTVNPSPVAGRPISGASGVCVGATTTLSDTSITGAWSSANTAIATVTTGGIVRGVTTGVTTIRYIVSNSCGADTATKTFTVSNPPTSGTITGSSTICIGTPATFTESVSGGTWTSSDTTKATVSATGTVTGVAAGTATISYTVTNSCSSVSAVQPVTVNTVPVTGPIYGRDSVCPGSSVTLSDSVSGGVWSVTNTSLATINSSTGALRGTTTSGGRDTVVYTISNSCGNSSRSIPFTINPAPYAATVSGSGTVCLHSTATYSDSVTGGAWSSSNNSVATVNTGGVVYGVNTGSASIIYTVTNVCGTASSSASVSVITLPNASISGPSTVNLCLNSTLSAGATPAGGFWRRSNAHITLGTAGVTGSTDTISLTASTVGNDSITYVASNSCGTDTSAIKLVQVQPLADTGVISGPSSVCVGSSVTLTETATGGEWGVSVGSGRAFVDASGVVSGFSGGVAIITYTNASTYCGIMHASHQMFVNLLPNAGSISGVPDICPGGTDTLTDPTGAISGIYWLSADTTIATVGLTNGVARGIITDSVLIYAIDTSNGACGADTASFLLHVHPGTPDAGIILGLDTVCAGGTVMLADSVTGGTWSSSNTSVATVSSTGTASSATGGTTTISYTITNSCGTGRATHTLNVIAYPVLTSNPTPAAICDNTPFTYNPAYSTSPVSFVWRRRTATGISNPADSGTTNINETLHDTLNTEVYASYVITATTFGCTDSATVVAGINPTPHLTSPLTDTVCSGQRLVYNVVLSTGGSSSATWVLTAGPVTAVPTSGSGNISEILTSDSSITVSATYVYSMAFNGCSNSENVVVAVEPTPAMPQITTHSAPNLCTGAAEMNFGASSAPGAGVNYTWSATGAEIWATGNTRQYCLVNFDTTGVATIYLSASAGNGSCNATASFAVSVGGEIVTHPEVIYFNGDFICESNTMDTYQWGFDNAGTLDSTFIPGQTSQNYTNSNPDFTHNLYWVITTSGGCLQKTYYNPPTGITNVNTGGSEEMTIVPNPNNGTFILNIASTSKENATLLITDMVGKTVKTAKVLTNQDNMVELNEATGMYFVTVVTHNGKYTQKIVLDK